MTLQQKIQKYKSNAGNSFLARRFLRKNYDTIVNCKNYKNHEEGLREILIDFILLSAGKHLTRCGVQVLCKSSRTSTVLIKQ